jgi:DNA-binding transcriptional LysR family regulator
MGHTLGDHRRNEISVAAQVLCMNAKNKNKVERSALQIADLPLVLSLARGKTLARAAESLDVDVSTVFRRLNTLEKRLGVRLFDRAARGYRLTPAGEHAAATAERMEVELHALDREITGGDQRLTGTLRVTASETLSYAVLPQLFAEFQAAHPAIQLILTIDNRLLDLSRREADVALRTRRPTDANLFGRKLAGIAWTFYGPRDASGGLRRDGARFNFARHRVIGWDDPAARIIASDWLAENVPEQRILYRSNSLVNQLAAVRAGVGIALLPCYLGDADPAVRRLTPPLDDMRGELWIVTHKDLKETARVRTFLTVVGDGIAASKQLFEGGEAKRGMQ